MQVKRARAMNVRGNRVSRAIQRQHRKPLILSAGRKPAGCLPGGPPLTRKRLHSPRPHSKCAPAVAVLIACMFVGSVPVAAAAHGGLFGYGPSGSSRMEWSGTSPTTDISLAAGPGPAQAPAGGSEFSPVPLSLSNGAAQNYSPFSPSAFVFSQVSPGPNIDGVNIAALPNLSIAQAGNWTVAFNGTWNPAPAIAGDRDWVLAFGVRNGQAQPFVVESNTTVRFTLNVTQVPFQLFFALPSTVAFFGAPSTARISAFSPPSNLTVLNLTASNAGVPLAGNTGLPPMPTKSVWLNASGSYGGSGILNGTQTYSMVVPSDGGLPFEARSGRVSQWTNTSNFPGGRFMLLKGAPSVVVLSNYRATVWTRGSPESSVFLNATVTPTQAFRNDSLNISGTVGNRTLSQGGSWVANTTAAVPPNSHNTASCYSLVRLVNGSYRLFCVWSDSSGPGTQYGIDSAFSREGTNWSWEAGTRYQLCGGQHTITQTAIFRGIDGMLRMYYGGSDPLLACTALGSGMHISSATSVNDGLTWTLETETLSNFGVLAPDARAIVPTAEGHLRMYYDSASGLSTALSDDGSAWTFEATIGGSAPRSLYLLSDGSYKMYFGTTTISSRVSANGLSWGGLQVELTDWGVTDIEAGPVLDRGDGSQVLLVYSHGDGLFLAPTGASVSLGIRIDLAGRASDAQPFGATSVLSGARDSFQANVSIPPGAALGRFFISASAGFGENRFRGVVLNRLPTWSGPASVDATEDVPLLLNLSAWAADADVADTPTAFANSPYLTLNGSIATLLYPNGVLTDNVFGVVVDGHDMTAFTFTVAVAPVNDAPTLALNASYAANEDALTFIDFAPAIGDEETPGSLTLSTNISGASIVGSSIGVNYTLDGTYNVTIRVTDGTTLVSGSTLIVVSPRDDPPVLTLAPVYNGDEDLLINLDFAPAVFDEDTPLGSLVLSTTLANSTVSGLEASLVVADPGTVPFHVTLSDGTTSVMGQSVLLVGARNDPPVWLNVQDLSGVTEDVRFLIDLTPYVFDPDTAVSGLTFSEDSPYAVTYDTRLDLLFPEGVVSASLNLTVTDGEFSATVQVNVTITPVDDPPSITNAPPANYTGNVTLQFQFDVTDPDSAAGFDFTLLSAPSWVTLSPAGALSIAPPAGLHGRFNYTFVVTDPTGAASPLYTFSIALPANRLPMMDPTFAQLPANAVLDTLFRVEFNVTDADGDPVAVSAAGFDPSQTVSLVQHSPGHWSFSWTPTYPGGRVLPFSKWLNGTLLLDDSFAIARYDFSIRAMDPPSAAPLILGTIPTITGEPGADVVFDLTPFMSDPDVLDTLEFLDWTFEGNVSGFATLEYDQVSHQLTVHFLKEGNVAIVFRLWDPSLLSDSQPVVLSGVVSAPAQSAFPWWILLLIAGAAAAGALVVRRVRAGAALEAAVPAAAPSGGRAAGAPPRAAPAVRAPPVAAPSGRRAFLIEDVFLLYRDGRTIFTRSGLGADAVEDPESVGAMLVAVQDFVKDSFRKGSPVDRMGYGDNVILLEQGDNALLAITVFGEPDREFRELVTETLRNVEASYAGVIENWSGNRADFVGVEAILAPVWTLTAHLTRGDVLLATTAREVQMLSGVEFFQGFVRLKVGIVNNTTTVITGVTVDLDFNADVLRLHKIEPPGYKSSAAKVNLGVLHSGEKATLAYYFDPQICTMSMIDGTARYKDAEGAQHVVQMKSRKAEVVCPLFFTKEQANTAMLRRLVETELNQFDVRAFSFKEGAKPEEMARLFEAMKSSVLAHDVQAVRAFERHNPYVGESWFYGKTQVKGYQMVIRAVVDEEKGRAEFFVASTVMRSVTGLLAELAHTFQRAAVERLSELELAPLFDEAVRGEYADLRAVSKMIESEAAAGETDV